jgi:hypothetical protein
LSPWAFLLDVAAVRGCIAGAGGQSQHLDAEDSAGTALLYMRVLIAAVRMSLIGTNRRRIAGHDRGALYGGQLLLLLLRAAA